MEHVEEQLEPALDRWHKGKGKETARDDEQPIENPAKHAADATITQGLGRGDLAQAVLDAPPDGGQPLNQVAPERMFRTISPIPDADRSSEGNMSQFATGLSVSDFLPRQGARDEEMIYDALGSVWENKGASR
jgi:hypothetical protein